MQAASQRRGNGLFILLVTVTLGCSLYDLVTTQRHLQIQEAQQPPACFETTLRRDYFKQLRRAPIDQQLGVFPTADDAATLKVTPLLLLPEQLTWHKRKANARHLLQDGVAQSPWLTWYDDTTSNTHEDQDESMMYPDNLVVILDLLGARDVSDDWCNTVSESLVQLQSERLAQQLLHQNPSFLRPLPLAVVDNRDYPVISYCPGLARILLQGHNGTISSNPALESWRNQLQQQNASNNHIIRYSYRSAVLRRKWQPHLNWVRVGKLLMTQDESDADDDDDESSDDDDLWIDYRHRPIGVRTDIVQQVQEYLTTELQPSSRNDAPQGGRVQTMTSLCHAIEELPRDISVSYFWDHQNHSRSDAHLRDTVYEVLSGMALQQQTSALQTTRDDANIQQHGNWNFQLGVQGENRDRGRKRASPAYVVALMQSKIVVVAQRDEWEDHYRLLEAIVSGAMVMTDQMLGLPDGLVNGESVVTFASAQELRDKVAYYLEHDEERCQIAKRGRFVAMSRHRSWHHMEEIVFGEPVTTCNNSTGSKCPYVVNVNEMNEDCPLFPTSSDGAVQAQR